MCFLIAGFQNLGAPQQCFLHRSLISGVFFLLISFLFCVSIEVELRSDGRCLSLIAYFVIQCDEFPMCLQTPCVFRNVKGRLGKAELLPM